VELRRWPRKNDPESIRARQDELAPRLDGEGEVFAHDLTPFARATEAITGVALVPVAVVGPLDIELGDYSLEEPDGLLAERGRDREGVYVPLANTEGGLSISLYRGARAVGESGGFRTYILKDRITRAAAFLFQDVAQAVAFSEWVQGQLEEMKSWLASEPVANLSKHAKLREIETHVVGPMCHVMYAFTTGDACGMNMITRNSYALNQGFVLERTPIRPARSMLEGNMGGDKKPSARYFERGGHGKTVVAEATLTEDAVRRVLKTSLDDLAELAFVGTHGAIASGMQSVAFTPATAIAAIFAATGQDIGMVGTSSMAHGTAHVTDAGLHVSMRLASLEVATVGGGTTLPYARSWLRLMGCDGPGKVYRLAQIVAAATLSLEISASAAMATAGSENFYRAHFERGGLR
jgi:hydroxymethylglutaryl-CoA reductase (NADPH)